jgi:hypothetical protein
MSINMQTMYYEFDSLVIIIIFYLFNFFVMLFHMSLFRLELESYTDTALVSIPVFALY